MRSGFSIVNTILVSCILVSLGSCRQQTEPKEYIQLEKTGAVWITKTITTYAASMQYAVYRLKTLHSDLDSLLLIIEADEFVNREKLDIRTIESFLLSLEESIGSYATAVSDMQSNASRIDSAAINAAYMTTNTMPEITDLKSQVNSAWDEREQAVLLRRDSAGLAIFRRRRMARVNKRNQETQDLFLALNNEYSDAWRSRLLEEYTKRADTNVLISIFNAVDDAQNASRETTWASMNAQSEINTLRSRYETVKEWIMLDEDGGKESVVE
jgi:hypothetical protein